MVHGLIFGPWFNGLLPIERERQKQQANIQVWGDLFHVNACHALSNFNWMPIGTDVVLCLIQMSDYIYICLLQSKLVKREVDLLMLSESSDILRLNFLPELILCFGSSPWFMKTSEGVLLKGEHLFLDII